MDLHGHTAILGLWAKPMQSMRLNFDWEHTNNDNTIVRIAPRKESRYRVQVGYTPRPWAVLGGSMTSWKTTTMPFWSTTPDTTATMDSPPPLRLPTSALV